MALRLEDLTLMSNELFNNATKRANPTFLSIKAYACLLKSLKGVMDKHDSFALQDLKKELVPSTSWNLLCIDFEIGIGLESGLDMGLPLWVVISPPNYIVDQIQLHNDEFYKTGGLRPSLYSGLLSVGDPTQIKCCRFTIGLTFHLRLSSTLFGHGKVVPHKSHYFIVLKLTILHILPHSNGQYVCLPFGKIDVEKCQFSPSSIIFVFLQGNCPQFVQLSVRGRCLQCPSIWGREGGHTLFLHHVQCSPARLEPVYSDWIFFFNTPAFIILCAKYFLESLLGAGRATANDKSCNGYCFYFYILSQLSPSKLSDVNTGRINDGEPQEELLCKISIFPCKVVN
eukprot:Gb_13344 [translate_table: standard]